MPTQKNRDMKLGVPQSLAQGLGYTSKTYSTADKSPLQIDEGIKAGAKGGNKKGGISMSGTHDIKTKVSMPLTKGGAKTKKKK